MFFREIILGTPSGQILWWGYGYFLPIDFFLYIRPNKQDSTVMYIKIIKLAVTSYMQLKKNCVVPQYTLVFEKFKTNPGIIN